MEKSEKKAFNDKKAKKAYITWDKNDMDVEASFMMNQD